MLPRARAFVGLVAVALFGSCVAHDTPTGVGEELPPAGLTFQPALIPSPADAGALPVNRIRAVVTRVPDQVVLKDSTATVDPAATEWSLDVRVPLSASPARVIAHIYLINADPAGAGTVQFSAITDTLTLISGQLSPAGEVPLVRGPIANLYVTGVTITTTSPVVNQGGTLDLSATVETSPGAAAPLVFWTSLDTLVARFDSATVMGVAPGVTDVVASAGAHADTTTLTVVLAPVDSVEVSPSTANVEVGGSVQYTAVLRDANGNVLTGRTVTWSTASASVSTVDTNGLVTGVAPGSTTVTATSEGVSDDAAVVVQVASGGGATISWIAGTGGTWSTPSAWSLGRVPQPGDTVLLTTGVDYQVVLDTDVTVGSLRIGGTSDVISLVMGDYSLTLTDAGGGPALEILPLGSVTLGNGSVTAEHVVNEGSLLATGVAGLTVATFENLALWTVTSSATLTVGHPGAAEIWTSGALTLDGVLVIEAGHYFTYQGGQVTGAGLLTMLAGSSLILDADLSVDGPHIVLADASTVADAANRLTIGPASLLSLTSSDHTAVNTVLVLQGSLISTGTNAFLNDSLYVEGAVDVEGSLGTVDVVNTGLIHLFGPDEVVFGPGSATNRRILNQEAGTIMLAPDAGGGTRVLNGELINEGFVWVGAPSELRRTTAQGQHVAAQHVNRGTLEVAAGDLTIVLGGAGPTFTNEDTVSVRLGQTLFVHNTSTPAGAIINAPTGVLNGDGTIDMVSGGLPYPTGINEGTLAPGASPGLLTWLGGIPMGATSRIEIEIEGDQAGLEYDQLVVSGPLTVDGTLVVTNPGFVPTLPFRFAVMTFGSRTGTFTDVQLPAIDGAVLDTVWAEAGTADTLFIEATAAPAATLNRWQAATSGNWSTGANWSTGSPPQPGDSVVIDVDGTYTITLDGAATIYALHLGAASGTQTLSMSNWTLTLDGPGVVETNGLLTGFASTVTGSGTLTNRGTVSLGQGVIETPMVNEALLVADGLLSVSGDLTAAVTGTIRIQGNRTSGSGSLTTATDFTNYGLIEMTSAYQTTLQMGGSGTLVNEGTIESQTGPGPGTPRFMNGRLDNRGTLTVDHSLTLTGGNVTLTNSGAIAVNSGTFAVNMSGSTPSFTHTGTATIAAGAQWGLSGGTLFVDGGAISGAGTLLLSVMSVDLATDLSRPTTLNLSNTTVTGAGVITNASGETLELGGTTTALDNGGLVNAGLLLARGTPVVNAPLTALPEGTIRIRGDATWGGGSLTVSGGTTNQGLLELTSLGAGFFAQLVVTGGALTNTGTIIALPGAGGPRGIHATLDNQGAIHVFPGATGTLDLNGSLTNSGAISLELESTASYGRLAVTGSAALGGTLDVTNLGAFESEMGDTFIVLTYASQTGSFTTTNFPPTLGSGWTIQTNPTQLVLSVD